ncbi:hypothetical protein K8T06_13655, partial [bacterium]|nr:hypothetical protein [bacterium]
CPTVEDEVYGYELVAANHRIFLHRGVQVTHLAEYSFDSLLLRKFRMSFYQIKSLLRGVKPPVHGKNGNNGTHHSKDIIAATMIAPLLFMSWLWSWPAGLLMLLFYASVNARLWSYFTKAEPPVYAIEMFFITWFDQMSIFSGLLIGALDYFMGRKI